MYKFVFSILLLLVVATELLADEDLGFDHSHARLTNILQEYVSMQGVKSSVDYSALSKDQGGLNGYLAQIEALSFEDFQSFNEKQQLSFLINAYNAFTLKLIVDNYPLDSIKDLGSFFSSPWKKKFFSLFGEKRSLDYIEHALLRELYAEPRIHFALVCASRGCPALQRYAYSGDKLEQQLEGVTRSFLNDADRNRFDASQNILYLSSIFKWFRADFEKAGGSVTEFVSRYVSDLRNTRAKGKPRIRYQDYDWSLNLLQER